MCDNPSKNNSASPTAEEPIWRPAGCKPLQLTSRPILQTFKLNRCAGLGPHGPLCCLVRAQGCLQHHKLVLWGSVANSTHRTQASPQKNTTYGWLAPEHTPSPKGRSSASTQSLGHSPDNMLQLGSLWGKTLHPSHSKVHETLVLFLCSQYKKKKM